MTGATPEGDREAGSPGIRPGEEGRRGPGGGRGAEHPTERSGRGGGGDEGRHRSEAQAAGGGRPRGSGHPSWELSLQPLAVWTELKDVLPPANGETMGAHEGILLGIPQPLDLRGLALDVPCCVLAGAVDFRSVCVSEEPALCSRGTEAPRAWPEASLPLAQQCGALILTCLARPTQDGVASWELAGQWLPPEPLCSRWCRERHRDLSLLSDSKHVAPRKRQSSALHDALESLRFPLWEPP